MTHDERPVVILGAGLAGLTAAAKRDLLVDAHMAEPYSAMVLADALGVLPAEIHVVAAHVFKEEVTRRRVRLLTASPSG